MPRAPKKCGHRGCQVRVPGGTPYCPTHSKKPPSPTSTAARYDPAEAAARRALIKAWVDLNGWWCPGWNRPAHPSTDLTAAHTIAVSKGGKGSPLTVLCRSCNSRQHTRPT